MLKKEITDKKLSSFVVMPDGLDMAFRKWVVIHPRGSYRQYSLPLGTASVGVLPTMLKLKQRKLFYGSLMPILNRTADNLIPEIRRIIFYRALKQSPCQRKV